MAAADGEKLRSPNGLDPYIDDGTISRPIFLIRRSGLKEDSTFALTMTFYYSNGEKNSVVATAKSPEQAMQKTIDGIIEEIADRDE